MSEMEVANEIEEELQHPSIKQADEVPYPNPVYAWYVVGLLVLAYTFSFIDRQILSLLVEPMKRDLDISDTQMSLLQGIAFAFFYTLMGLPIGRMVDTKRRVTIIGIGIFVWSLMTALCGLAKSYWQLFFFRMGVGAGEASLTPAAYSLISDYFPPKRMGMALGVYGMGIYIGSGLALVIGAEVIALIQGAQAVTVPVLGELRSWQVVFIIVGLPGVLVAAWMFTLREPQRRGQVRNEGAAGGEEDGSDVLPLPEVLSYLRANWLTMVCQNMSYALAAMMTYAVAAWVPTFLLRTHDWSYVEAGRVYGWIVVIFGTTGVVFGGYLADWMSERFRAGRMMVMMITGLAPLPFVIIFPLTENMTVLLVCLAATTFLATFTTGAGPSALQEIMPNQIRGFASAIMIFVLTLVGLGLGPTSVAVVTDYVFGDPAAIRYSLAIVPAVILVFAFLFALVGLRPYARSRDYMEAWVRRSGR